MAVGVAFLVVLGFQAPAQAQTTGSSTITATLLNIEAELRALNARDPATRNDNRNANVNDNTQAQRQEQTQNVVFPFTRVGSVGGGDGSKLPKTGVDAAEVGGLGSATLLGGAGLMEFARRRRRHWFAPMSAAEAIATTTVTPAELPIAADSEGDLLLPYEARAPEAVTPPAAPQPQDPITPSF